MKNTNIYSKNLEHLVARRKEHLNRYEKSYDDIKDVYTINEPKEIDEIADEIIDYILKHKDDIEFEVIIETLTHIGSSPNLLYDDNGNFAITSDGIQSISFGDEPTDIETSFHVEKEHWFPTIRKALNHFLESYKEEV